MSANILVIQNLRILMMFMGCCFVDAQKSVDFPHCRHIFRLICNFLYDLITTYPKEYPKEQTVIFLRWKEYRESGDQDEIFNQQGICGGTGTIVASQLSL